MTPPHLAALALLLAPAHAAVDPAAPPGEHPCDRELLDDEEALERNTWAAGCGYVPEVAVTWAFIHDLWIAFERPGAPMDGNDPCAADWGRPITLCPAHID